MANSEHLFIQPWLRADESWAGFNVEFAGPPGAFGQALAKVPAHPAFRSLHHGLLWFIPVPDLGAVAQASAFPDKQTVFLVQSPEDAGGGDDWSQGAADLHRRGRRIGLALRPGEPLPLACPWSHVLLTASHARTLPSYRLANLSAKAAVAITGLRSRTDFSWAAAHQCALMTSEYLFHRSPLCHKADMLRGRLLKLLTLIAADADTSEIEEIFRHEPKLAYGLLRLVNSAALGLRSPIASFSQAITLLGRQQLQRWLQLLVYADPNDGQHPHPLLLQAATRGHLMETLAPGILLPSEREEPCDAAFMVGAFSLLDVLLNLPMAEILLQLPLPGIALAALEGHRGPLGKLLMALSAADHRDFETASRLLADLGIDNDTFISAQLSTLAWANTIRAAHSPGGHGHMP